MARPRGPSVNSRSPPETADFRACKKGGSGAVLDGPSEISVITDRCLSSAGPILSISHDTENLDLSFGCEDHLKVPAFDIHRLPHQPGELLG